MSVPGVISHPARVDGHFQAGGVEVVAKIILLNQIVPFAKFVFRNEFSRILAYYRV